MWGACDWEEGEFWVGGLWFYDWLEFESLVDLDQYESQYGLFDAGYQEISEDGASGYGEDT